jgi:hypothetical protein
MGHYRELVMELDELKSLIIYNLDVVNFLDIIGVGIEDLVELCEDQVRENFDALVVAVE